MDQKLFEQKLTEVAEWRREKISNETFDNKRAQPCCDSPTEIILDRVKPKPCPYIQDNQGCYFHTKWYPYVRGMTIRVQYCKTCKAVITPQGNVLENQSLTNIASRVYWADHKE